MVLMCLLAGQQWRCRCREQPHGHSGGGEKAKNGESSMETYTLPYGKQRASENLLHDSGGCDSLEGWDGRWEGGSRGRGHMYTCG